MTLKKFFKKISPAVYFLSLVILGYFVLFLFKRANFYVALKFTFVILSKVVPVLVLVFVLMVLVNYYLDSKVILKYIQGSNIRKWFFTVLAGILSSGPIYMWYPLLAELKNKGLDNGLLACFLYNRAIKLPLLPILLLYFSWPYVVTITLIMIIFSILQGLIINKLI